MRYFLFSAPNKALPFVFLEFVTVGYQNRYPILIPNPLTLYKKLYNFLLLSVLCCKVDMIVLLSLWSQVSGQKNHINNAGRSYL